MIGIDQQRQAAGAADATGLLGELGQREDDEIGRAEHRERRDRARKHPGLEAQILGDARGDGVEDRGRPHAARPRQDGAEAPAPLSPIHRFSSPGGTDSTRPFS